MKKFFFIFLLPLHVLGHEVDGVEHLFGATNINAFTGNGGFTAGLSEKGEITVLRWPSPGFYDHLNYFTAIVPVNAGYHATDLPHLGALENMGIFAGIKKGGKVTWLRDLPSEQRYSSPDDPVVLTEFQFDGKRIIQETFIPPFADVLVFHFYGPEEIESIIFYENLAPCNRKAPYIPLLDWYDDINNDFAAFYEDGTVFHFIPREADFSLLEKFDVKNLKDKPGTWFSIGGSKHPISYQIGHDSYTGCPRYFGWKEGPTDAYEDAKDGVLSGSPYGGCQVNSAIEFPFHGTLDVYISVSGSYRESKEVLKEAIEKGYEKLEEETKRFWSERLKKASLPPEFQDFSKRTLLSIMLAMDRESGGVVASISTQPPYGEDWPRDGAFINLALDIAGYHDLVTEHNLFYTKVQRKSGIYPFGRGTFDMCYYPDGMPGGPIPFEIDETALVVWTLWMHVKFLKEGRNEYIEKVRDTMEMAAEALYECYDGEKKLQCFANEDDNPLFTQGLQGAATYYLAMMSASEFFSYLGKEEDSERFRRRAEDIKSGIIENFYTGEGFESYYGAISWLLWPAGITDGYNLKSLSDYLISEAEKNLRKETEGFGYISKGLLAVAMVEREEYLSKLKELTEILIKEVPTPLTMHMGEVAVVRDGKFVNRVAIPHIWEASLSYLLAMAVYRPEVFSPLFVKIEREKGCGCSHSSSGSFPLVVSAFLLLLRSYMWKRGNS